MAIDPDVQVELDVIESRLAALEAGGIDPAVLTAFNLRLEAVEAWIQSFNTGAITSYEDTYGDTYG